MSREGKSWNGILASWNQTAEAGGYWPSQLWLAQVHHCILCVTMWLTAVDVSDAAEIFPPPSVGIQLSSSLLLPCGPDRGLLKAWKHLLGPGPLCAHCWSAR